MNKKNIHPTKFKITNHDRISFLNQKPILIWFTGLSGSGKSTLANGIEIALFKKGFLTYLLDGDNVRSGLNKDLGFSDQDRIENIRRIAEVSSLFIDAGVIVISAFISPFINDREMIRMMVGDEKFIEIHVDCPIEICEKRDVKGLYAKARSGQIKNFTGIDSPYEAPVSPFMKINSADESLEISIEKLLEGIIEKIKI